ncbi:MAG: LVIVD repeat-containing protein [Acidimicrobiales bacterium]
MRWPLVSLMVLAAASPVAAAQEPGVADLKVVAHLDLGTPGPHGDLAVAGSTAVVAAGACSNGPLTVVSLADPRRPRVVATIALPTGAAAIDLDGNRDTVAVALDPCRSGGTLLYDLARPAAPELRTQAEGTVHAVAIAERRDGRRLVLSGTNQGVRITDVSDPANPSPEAVWTPPTRVPCGAVQPFEDGRRALAVCGDRVYELDLSSPSSPSLASTAPAAAGRPESAVGVLLSERTLAVVSEDALRVLELQGGQDPREVAVLRSPANHPPGRVVASGELAFVAWRGGGLRVIDLGSPGMPAIARFVPPVPTPNVVAVALLPNHVVVTDAQSGLWVVDRPKEGSKESGSDDVKVLLGALAVGGLLMFVVVPKVVSILSMAGQAATAPRRAAVRRAR